MSIRDWMSNEINVGLMADIVFLFLIFFFVMIIIVEDKGIIVKLLFWLEEEFDIIKLKKWNVFLVLVNVQDQFLVCGELVCIEELCGCVKEFISNFSKLENLVEKLMKVIILFKNDWGIFYDVYLIVYNELKVVYFELWDEFSQCRYGVLYSEDMFFVYKKVIWEEIFFVFLEVELIVFGEEQMVWGQVLSLFF